MSLSDFLAAQWGAFQQTRIFEGTMFTGAAVALFIAVILLLLGVTLVLRAFFKHHPFVDHAHRYLIYLLTMSGVLLLVLGGVMGLFLPIIPGIPMLLLALILMRRYHRSEWVESKIARLKRKLAHYEAQRRAMQEARVRASDLAHARGPLPGASPVANASPRRRAVLRKKRRT